VNNSNHIRFAFVFFLLLQILMACSKVEQNDVLARIGDRFITQSEFETRFALTPHYRGLAGDDQQTRKLTLASFIGEKILANAAVEHGLTETVHYFAFARQMEKEAVIEEMLDEVFGDIEISEQEIVDGYQKSRKILTVEELVYPYEQQALAARAAMDTTASLMTHVSGLTAAEDMAPASYRIKWGDSDPLIEDVLWQMQPGQVSQPVPYRKNYYIFRIARQETDVATGSEDVRRMTKAIRDKIYKRKKQLAYNRFFKEVVKGIKTDVSGQKMTFIAEQFEAALDIPASKQNDTTLFKPELMTADQLRRTGNRLQDRFDEVLITFDDGDVWTIQDFLLGLYYGPYPLNYSNKAAFRASLRNAAIMMMEQEYIAKEAYARNLDQSVYVKQEKRMWTDSFLADQMRKTISENAPANAAHANHDSAATSAQYIARLDEFLTNAVSGTSIDINHAALDTLNLRHLDMIAFKTHFPGRVLAPAILPLDRLPKYFSAVNTIMEKTND
jgi:hypothetical protein